VPARGLATGSRGVGEAEERPLDVFLKNKKYRDHLKKGETTQNARKLAAEEIVEHLGHSRNRKDLARPYSGG
jgi:hypothetical protein